MSMYKTEEVFDILYDDELLETEIDAQSDIVTPKEAFILSINRFGRVNLKYMSEVCGQGKDTLVRSQQV